MASVIQHVILLQIKWKKKYEVSQNLQKKKTTTLNCQCDWQIFALFQNGDTKITDWITSQKPIYRRHPINSNNNITDISQKKDLPTSANDTNIYRLSLWYNNNERLKLPSHTVILHSAIGNLTLDAPKTFERHSTQSFNKSIMSS